jgi:hypothetical protein
MFVQVIEGRVRDAAAVRAQLDTWIKELAPGATGWLGGTSGVTDDGSSIAVVRFESEEAARANSDRPEQGKWWEEMASLFDGEPTFKESSVVDPFRGGGSDDAGFVQVIQGKADRDTVLANEAALDEFLGRVRPDVLGGIMAWHDGGTFTQVVYFSSEAEARENEKLELSPEDQARFGEMVGMLEMERFFDLRDPWLHSA